MRCTQAGWRFIIFVFLFVSTSCCVYAQDGYTLRLRSGVVTIPHNAAAWIDSFNAHGNEPVQVLVHLSTVPDAETREILQASGFSTVDYFPSNTYSAQVVPPLKMVQGIEGITILEPQWKGDSYIWQRAAKGGMQQVLVTVAPGVSRQQLMTVAQALGGSVQSYHLEPWGTYRVVIDAPKLYALAQWYGTRYLAPATSIVPLDLQSRPAVKANGAVATPANHGYGLAGDSVTVGVGDNSSGILHADLKDRIVNFNPDPPATHGAHVNGIVGAAANVDPLAASMAPHVNLVDHLYDLVLSSTGAMYNDHNMTITNNSYMVVAGDCDYAGTYDAYSQFIDTMSSVYPMVQHVFAAGNDGWMSCSPYLPGFATVGGGYQPAKNNIVVGSMTDYLIQAADESRGPVKDGRLKPEIIAIGLGSYSTVGVDQYVWDAGTSMASPQVAGGVALLTQHYKRLHGGTQPRADLLKTVLLNGTMDLGNPGPDYSYGFGAMDINRSLKILDNNAYFTGVSFTSGVQTYTITVPANTGKLKVMLYWNDVPGNPMAATQLVNDLDITVTAPGGSVHKPLVLDPTPANVNNNAVEGEDHINNAEQVTIINPAAGTYTIQVKGYSVPNGPQAYAVAYDIVPTGFQLTYPLGGEALSNVDSIRVFWNAVSDGSTFNVDLSTDAGASWTSIAANIPAGGRYCPFMPSGINSGRCQIRLTHNAQMVSSGLFAISAKPVAAASASQCPGYLNIHWSPVPGAAYYRLLQKVGYYMQVVDSVADTVYTFGGLSLTEKSYVAVQPVINGLPGYRSVAVIAIANTGDCTTTASAGDLMLEGVVSPASGRQLTSSQLGSAVPLQLKVRNLYTSACSGYTISYSINGGAWQVATNPGTLAANSSHVITAGNVSLGITGSYAIQVAVTNTTLTDPHHSNDTLRFTVQNLPNDPVDLSTAFTDGFEDVPVCSVQHDSLGISPNAHWDYVNANDTGRLRSYVAQNITITGNRSMSLDEYMNVPSGSHNQLLGTFNLSGYDTASAEVRMDFDYLLHGMPQTADGNVVSARASDGVAWLPFFTYGLNMYPGILQHVKSLSLTDLVRSQHHNFSTSTQVSFGQNDTSLIASPSYGNGITLDNFRLYTVANDAQMVAVVSPQGSNCGMPSSMPLTVKVHNGVNYTLHNVYVFYRANGSVATGTIDSIKAKDTVLYTFAQPLNIPPGTSDSVDVWLAAAGDSYTANDSILNYHIRNSVIVTSYPYLENFEASDGGFYSEGYIDSWQYGTPASAGVHKAASGTKAWKTNLTGHYQNLENSYLYSPCYDISSLSVPMLSFSMAEDIENCGNVLCDAAWLEYSFDGAVWTKLGAAGQGTNWYDSSFNVWNTNNFTRWHVASIPLPQPPAGQTIRFRFVFSSDPGATFDGLAIDDIHIYDYAHGIFPASGVTTVYGDISSNLWSGFLQSDEWLAQIQSPGKSVSDVTVRLYEQNILTNPGGTQYLMPRSYTVKTDDRPADTMQVRLYLLDDEFVRTYYDGSCPSCTVPADAYSLGITRFAGTSVHGAENGLLTDDTAGTFTYVPYVSVQWVPYDKGYYAQFSSNPFGEFWFNDGGSTHTMPAGLDEVSFAALRQGNDAYCYWLSRIDTSVNTYTLMAGTDSVSFAALQAVTPIASLPVQGYSYLHQSAFAAVDTMYYRVSWTLKNSDSTYYSPVRRVTSSDTVANLIDFSAAIQSRGHVLLAWTSWIDPAVANYVVERAIGDGAYVPIASVAALGAYGRQYDMIDAPDMPLHNGELIHYRLTARLQNGTTVVLPIRTISWDNGNSLVNLYPNPVSDGTFSIAWHADAGTVMNVTISDAIGKRLFTATTMATQWSNVSSFNAGHLPKGIYFARIDIGGSRYAARIVFE